MTPSKKRLVAAKEAAETLGVAERTVRRWCQRHEVQAVLTPGGAGRWRVWVDEDGVVVRA
jgi:excisionase family DNA binding protein